jgi:hypothetical protein
VGGAGTDSEAEILEDEDAASDISPLSRTSSERSSGRLSRNKDRELTGELSSHVFFQCVCVLAHKGWRSGSEAWPNGQRCACCHCMSFSVCVCVLAHVGGETWPNGLREVRFLVVIACFFSSVCMCVFAHKKGWGSGGLDLAERSERCCMFEPQQWQ